MAKMKRTIAEAVCSVAVKRRSDNKNIFKGEMVMNIEAQTKFPSSL